MMPSLATDFGGLALKNPIVVASSPASETSKHILDCIREGAGAVIVKSMCRYLKNSSQFGYRRVCTDERGMWATSTFSRETLDAERGIEVVEQVAAKSSVPLIASIAGSDLYPECWIPLCQDAAHAGAKAIQLDLFYVPQPVCAATTSRALRELTKSIVGSVAIPVFPKLNVEIPAYFAAELFAETGVRGFSVLDSVRVPGPLSVHSRGQLRYRNATIRGMSSLFGSWQLPLTQHYTFVLRRHSTLPICAGGGASTLEDTIGLLMIGATAVQFATPILVDGPKFITSLLSQMEHYLSESGLKTLDDIRDSIVQRLCTDAEESLPEYVSDAKAHIDHDKCKLCGRCFEAMFCDALAVIDGRVVVNEIICEGCGFCAGNCPNDAIKVLRGSSKVAASETT